MENLFSTTITVNDQPVRYQVIFADEQYTFLPENGNKEVSTFSLKRENDEWHDQELLSPDVKNQAVDALEKYLLQQH